jgi:hypothetical protein
MLTEIQREYVRKVLPTMQIIVGALTAGVVMFLVTVLLIGPANGGPPVDPFITYLGVGFSLIVGVTWIVVPRLIGGQLRRSIVDGRWRTMTPVGSNAEVLGDVPALTSAYQTRMIISCAMLEGIAFLNLVAYMLERRPISLAVAGILILMLLGHFPTFGRVRNWLEDELATIKQLRALGSQHGR